MTRNARHVLAPLLKLTVFAVVTITVTVMLASTISSLGFGSRSTYKALFTDATGLLDGDDVRIAGVKVGQIEHVAVRRQDGSDVAEVTFSVAADQPLTRGTRARLRYRNIVGQRYLALEEGPGGSVLGRGATIPLTQTEPALDLTTLFNGFRPLFAALDPKQVNTFAYEIIRVLQGEGGTVNSLLARTASLTSTLADRDVLIGQVIDNLNTVLDTVNVRDGELSQLILQLQRFVSGLAADRTAIGDSLANISALSVETAGLLTDSRPALKADIAQLRQVAGTLHASSAVVSGVLQRLPGKLALITATASDGSWFNFYLCSAGGTVSVAPVSGRVPVQAFSAGDARCGG